MAACAAARAVAQRRLALPPPIGCPGTRAATRERRVGGRAPGRSSAAGLPGRLTAEWLGAIVDPGRCRLGRDRWARAHTRRALRRGGRPRAARRGRDYRAARLGARRLRRARRPSALCRRTARSCNAGRHAPALLSGDGGGSGAPPRRPWRGLLDRCQGGLQCVLVSLVRANDSGETGALIADFRRLNVALSRAKAKMVVVGSARTLSHSPVLSAFLQLSASQGWVVQLPPRAMELYEGDGSGSPPADSTAQPQAAVAADTPDAYVRSNAVPSVPSNRPITAAVLQELHGRVPTLIPPRPAGAAAPTAAQSADVEW